MTIIDSQNDTAITTVSLQPHPPRSIAVDLADHRGAVSTGQDGWLIVLVDGRTGTKRIEPPNGRLSTTGLAWDWGNDLLYALDSSGRGQVARIVM